MKKHNRRYLGIMAAAVILALFVLVAYAADWLPDQRGEYVDPNFVWSGEFEPSSNSQQYVCLVFEGDVLPPVVCDLTPTADPNDPPDRVDYVCTLTAADVTTDINWEIVHAATAQCTSYGIQDPPGDSGTIGPLAISLAGFSAAGAGAGQMTFVLAVVAGLLVLGTGLALAAARVRNEV